MRMFAHQSAAISARPAGSRAVPAKPPTGRGRKLQRHAACACGGGCPRCQTEAHIQPKLAISEPGDAFEQEADRIADQVMRMPDARVRASPALPSLQRKCAACEEEEKSKLQTKRQSSDAGSSVTTAPSIVHEVLRSPGQPLDNATRAFMEPRFGDDFSRVRVHADARAAESARAVGASAYTVGQQVVFADGRYTPESDAGRRLLAHELAHVSQQTRQSPNGLRLQRQATPTPESVIDFRIDVRAQFALLRLFKKDPPDGKDAVDLFNDVRSGKIKGVYGDDLAVAAVLAGERNKARWELVPQGEDAVVIDDGFDDSPVVVFKESAGQEPRLDDALLAAYRAYSAAPAIAPKTAPPPFNLRPKPPSPSGPPRITCTFSVNATLMSTDDCLPGLCGVVQRWKYNSVTPNPPCTYDFDPSDQLIEDVKSDGNCTGQAGVRTGVCAIAPNGSLGQCTDSYGICKPPDQLDFGSDTTCTEIFTQDLFVDGPSTGTVFVESHQIVFTFEKTGTDCSASVVRL